MDNKTLIETVASRLSLNKEEAVALQAALASVIADSLLEGDSVAVPSFGNFETKKRQERVSVHPATGKRLLVPPKIVAAFRPSAVLKSRLS